MALKGCFKASLRVPIKVRFKALLKGSCQSSFEVSSKESSRRADVFRGLGESKIPQRLNLNL